MADDILKAVIGVVHELRKRVIFKPPPDEGPPSIQKKSIPLTRRIKTFFQQAKRNTIISTRHPTLAERVGTISSFDQPQSWRGREDISAAAGEFLKPIEPLPSLDDIFSPANAKA